MPFSVLASSDKGCVKQAEVKTAKVKHFLCAGDDRAGRAAAKGVLERGCNAGSGGACHRVYLAALQGNFGTEKEDFDYAVECCGEACLGGDHKLWAPPPWPTSPSLPTALRHRWTSLSRPRSSRGCELIQTSRKFGLLPDAKKAKNAHRARLQARWCQGL